MTKTYDDLLHDLIQLGYNSCSGICDRSITAGHFFGGWVAIRYDPDTNSWRNPGNMFPMCQTKEQALEEAIEILKKKS